MRQSVMRQSVRQQSVRQQSARQQSTLQNGAAQMISGEQPGGHEAGRSTRSPLPLPEESRFDMRALVGDACIFGGLLMWVFLLLGSMR